MEKFVERTLLYDFYGELLTEHQQSIYEDVVLNDYSCTEVAAERGISRQGVHDMIRRCDKILSDYEEKLHLVERFLEIRYARSRRSGVHTDCPDNIKRIADEILE
ncbi:MAG: YlxM family DNA-binding protein [Lachnospiraceae bacterium]